MKNNGDLWSINDRPSKETLNVGVSLLGCSISLGFAKLIAIIKFEIMLGYLNLRDKILEFILSETVVG